MQLKNIVMKNLKIVMLLAFPILTFAQNPVIDLKNYYGDDIVGAYFKDIDNSLNVFEGTYVYTNGNEIFKIVMIKKNMQFNTVCYEDLIIGEYQHIKNGVETINTLSEINTVYINQRKHNINGNALINNDNRQWRCPQCNPDEKRFRGVIFDELNHRTAKIFMRRTQENGHEVMKVKVNVTGKTYIATEGPPPEFSLPTGEFTMIKQ